MKPSDLFVAGAFLLSLTSAAWMFQARTRQFDKGIVAIIEVDVLGDFPQ